MTLIESAPSPALRRSVRGVPRSLDHELPRERLIRSLGRRWDHAITLVVAGAGFGKTTALAQTIRAHALDPRGIDAWVTCDPQHEDASRLARALIEALPGSGPGADCPTRPGVADVLAALVARAPLEVCLTVDDVHEVPAGSPGAGLLGELAGALPATVHLVLSGRETAELSVARREAAGDVLRIGPGDLAFTEVEVAALERCVGQRGHPGRVTKAGTFGGWPALVRLVLAAGPTAPLRYAREEILSRLSDAERHSLAALAALGTATADEVLAVVRMVGRDLPGGWPALDDLCRRIPLVGVLDDGRYRAHDLWADAVARALPVPELSSLRRHAIVRLTDRGDLNRAGSLACLSREWDLLADLAVKLVRETLTALPLSTAERWLAALPPSVADVPAFTLLRAAAMQARDYTDPRVDRLLDDAWHAALAQEHADAASAALGQAVVTAHSRADHLRLASLASRADQLGASPAPVIGLLRCSVAGVLAELGGDPDAAVAAFAQAPMREVPPPLALSALRFQVHCLAMCGRNAEAAALADRTLSDATDPYTALTGAMARWFGGDPKDLDWLRSSEPPALLLRPDVGDSDEPGTVREAFVTRAQAATMASSWGEADRWPARPAGDPASHDNPRDAILAAAAAASVAVGQGDEDAGRALYAALLARWPVTVRAAERHLRRFLALGYVLSDALRTHWDSVEPGPSHRAARAAGRAVVRARAGDLTEAASLPPAHALCFLPLPWSVELAARLATAHHPGGFALGQWLADHVGPAVHDQFKKVRQTYPGSARFLAALPAPPAHRQRILVLGPMRLLRDGIPVDAPQLRRTRVRQLLSALVLSPTLDRSRVMRLLWPDHDQATAASNLRVTLTHLRRLLEPDRSGGAASFHLRTDADTIRLQRSDWLAVDLWTADDLVTGAEHARAAGDTDRAMELFGQAVALWCGDPLPELVDLPDLDTEAEVARVRARHVRSLLTLGTLRLVTGDEGEAHRLAGRALALEPFDDAGHRLLLAAAVRSRDPVRTGAARDLVMTALRQLAVVPDPAMAVLLRQAQPAG